MTRRLRALRLVAACLRPDAGGTEGAALRSACVDWTAPIAFANEQLLVPTLHATLHASLGAAGLRAELPAEVGEYLSHLYRANAARNDAIRRQARHAVHALNGAGIVPMLLKGGAALYLDYHPDPAARMFRDLDLLVPRLALADAVGILRALGYGVEYFTNGDFHAFADFTRPGDPCAIDLHFELIDQSYMLSAAEIRSRARSLAVDGIRFLVPAPTDLVLHNILHQQIHYLGNFYRGALDLRQLYELSCLVRRYGSEIDWESIERRAALHRIDTALHSYLYAAQSLLGVPWPLEARPSRRAALHYRRCLAQIAYPTLDRAMIPWGNLRACFAWHRMAGLYGDGGPLAALLLRHAAQFVGKKKVGGAFQRLFRVR